MIEALTLDMATQPIEALPSPRTLARESPLSPRATAFIAASRKEIAALIHGRDPRQLAIVGPCSIHDPRAALDYAQRLVGLRRRFADELFICMRVYFEKPRTTVGWKGLINDPDRSGRCDIATGLRCARELLVALAELELPAASELLDPNTPAYLADALSWAAIGARTSESQPHRELASALPMPVGFKNATNGDLDPALHAIIAARAPQSFPRLDAEGRLGVARSPGNPYAHLVLRGGRGRPNHHAAQVDAAARLLREHSLPERVLIDCSHDNSGKDPDRQRHVLAELGRQLEQGSRAIAGVMLESNLVAGRQDPRPVGPLVYGQSVTDACLDYETTEQIVATFASTVRASRPTRVCRVACPTPGRPRHF